MASFTIQIPNSDLADVVEAFSAGWFPTLPDGTPNPVTKAQYAKNQIKQFIRTAVKSYRQGLLVTEEPNIEVT